MPKPSPQGPHIHVTDALEKCWTCSERNDNTTYVGGMTFTIRDPDVGIIACPHCSKEKIP